jgi:methionyl-tRNA formyltransferase
MRILFIGTGEIGVPALRALQHSKEYELAGVVTQPDKPAGRDQRLTPPPIKLAISGTSTPLLQPAKIKAPDAVASLRALNPDVIVVMAYGQILPRTVLDLPRLTCLNLHASLLPRWRGAAPIQAAIAAGDRETGITVMYMDEGLDTGDILLQRPLEIAPSETGGSLHDRLGAAAPEAMLAALRWLAQGGAPRVPQDEARATLAPKLNRESGRIDWTEPAEVIERKIRAFNPWPGAFTAVKDASGKPRNLKVHSAVTVDGRAPAGTIMCADERGLVMAAADRSLSLEEVQLEGKRRMSAAEFVRGTRLMG